MNNAPTTSNIIAAYVAASPADLHEGLSWYGRARALASELSPENPARAAGVIAAMSPLLSWPQNELRAREVFETGTTRGLSRNVSKAERIYNGEDPLNVLSGPKVLSFFHNIMGTGEDAVTVDRHAIDAAVGRTLSNNERAALVSGKRYKNLAVMYRDAASLIGVKSSDMQAVVWVYWRRTHAQAFHG